MDAGWNINATVTAPPPSGSNPPTVTITQPVQTSYTYSATDQSAQIVFAFEAGTASPSTIFSIDATVNGQPPTLTKQGLGTILATGTGNIPVTAAGT
jgi:hypothetical protein